MDITFYAHASFRLRTPQVTVVTDPYTPAISGFRPIDEAADLVVMSSATDRFHSDPSHLRGDPAIVNALLDVPADGLVTRGVSIRAFPTSESLTFDYGRDPDANAMYLLRFGGLRVLHLGDVGIPLPADMLGQLAGQVDVLLALAGAHATIALPDLDAAIDAIGPRVVIPMHYWHPRGVLKIDPVENFLARHPEAMVERCGAAHISLDAATLPATRRIVVLEQSR